jgi:hypothetical protein
MMKDLPSSFGQLHSIWMTMFWILVINSDQPYSKLGNGSLLSEVVKKDLVRTFLLAKQHGHIFDFHGCHFSAAWLVGW